MCCKTDKKKVLVQFLSKQSICPRPDFCVFSSLCLSRVRSPAFLSYESGWGWWQASVPLSWTNMKQCSRNMLHIAEYCKSKKAEKRKNNYEVKINLCCSKQTIIRRYFKLQQLYYLEIIFMSSCYRIPKFRYPCVKTTTTKKVWFASE